MRSRTSEPGSISQKRARSKSGPSGGTATLNRVTATLALKSPIPENLLLISGLTGADGRGILADGRRRGGRNGGLGGFLGIGRMDRRGLRGRFEISRIGRSLRGRLPGGRLA